MYILDVMETCNDSALSTVLPVVKAIMLIIQIAVPVALLISFTIDFVKLTINPEQKDGFRKLLNKLIAAIIVFVLPTIMNVVMGAVGESTEFSNCWNNAPNSINIWGDYTYVETDDEKDYPSTDTPTNTKNTDKYTKIPKQKNKS